MSYLRPPQAHSSGEAVPAGADAPLPVAVRRPLPRPRRPAPQVTVMDFDSFEPSDIDWYKAALWWRNLYFDAQNGCLRAQHIANCWHERSDGWRSLYYALKAKTSPAPAQAAAAVQPAVLYLPARARNRSHSSPCGARPAPY